jgi:hypothetical protein
MSLAISLTFGIFLLEMGMVHGPCEYFIFQLSTTLIFLFTFNTIIPFAFKFHLHFYSNSVVTFIFFLIICFL